VEKKSAVVEEQFKGGGDLPSERGACNYMEALTLRLRARHWGEEPKSDFIELDMERGPDPDRRE